MNSRARSSKPIPPWEQVRVVQRGASLAPGTVVILQMRLLPPLPLWITWEALHTLYQKDVLFQDVQRRGPFARWVHTHRFVAEGEQTRLLDEVDFTLPLGPLGQRLGARAGAGAAGAHVRLPPPGHARGVRGRAALAAFQGARSRKLA